MFNEFNFETFICVFFDVLSLYVNFYFYFQLLNSKKVSGSKLDLVYTSMSQNYNIFSAL